ncbi:MAG: hypothetical protein KBC06_02170 [Candidatus Pacebacteria bacterium]|nr:hypothetical protein [Candidatus Paceibacterota bacterium]
MVNQTGWSPWVDEWSGEPDIIYVQSTMTAQQMDANGLLGSVKQQLAVDVNVTYVVFLEAASSGNCGQASTTRVAVLYLQSPGCNTLSFDGSPTGPPSPWARFTLHETFHSAGAVSAGAPDYDLEHGGHVKTTCDLMHYSMCQDVTIDATGRNYLGDNVPPGVVNIKNDPFFHFVRAPTPGLRAVGSDVPLRVPLWNDARRP